jgi:alkylation response protein AidB-like acyl-CoA dehydrogenase
MASNGENGANGSTADSGNSKATPQTDPAAYQKYQDEWSTLPTNAEEWVNRARAVAEVLALDAAQRDKENKSPRAEIALLKHAGLLKVLGPKKYGGGEEEWHVGYQVVDHTAYQAR